MREYFEAQKRLLLDQVSNQDPEMERKLKQIFGEALDSAFGDMEENGVQPDSEERFWKNLSQALSENGCFRHGYRYFENVLDRLYLELENQFRCWPPQEDPDWLENADYIQVQRWDEGNRHKYFTLILPAEPEGLRTFLQENGLSSLRECRSLYANMKEPLLRGLETTLSNCGNLMEVNFLFYRLGQLSEREKRSFAYAAETGKYTTAKEFINLTANLDGMYILDGVRSTEELGRLLVENDLSFIHFENKMLPYLDYIKIAEKHIEETGGRLCRETYIENGMTPEEWVEIYDGTYLPDFTLAQEEALEKGIEEAQEEAPGFGGMTL